MHTNDAMSNQALVMLKEKLEILMLMYDKISMGAATDKVVRMVHRLVYLN